MTIEGLLVFVLVGLVAGWLAGMIVRGNGYGVAGDIVVGILGSIVGGFLFGMIGLNATGLLGSIVVAFCGAVVLIFVMRTLTRVGV
ncbi:MAG: GlsB/YeaQ/YmgE family stress response membrane protein [Chloroflexi bacterium]|nr:GlsB/YeaQ/YmgE family stress response membrane protein [Chloroflexota bacterium]